MTVSEQIIEVIDALCAKVGIAIDWTGENVLPYIETLYGKLINYEVGTSIVYIVIFLALIAGSIVAIKKFKPVFKNGLDNSKSYEIGWEMATAFSIIGLVFFYIISLIVVVGQIMDIVKCMTFPEMYVFEYVQGIISAG